MHTPDVAPVPNLTMPSFDGRALSYADLRAVEPTTLPVGPTRSFRLVLGGDMARYIWTIGGQAYPKAEPLLIRRGDRVEVEMKNETMMWHPMHLHGHFFRVLQGAGAFSPLKHTVNVAPGETVKFEFTASPPTIRDAGSSTATISTTLRLEWRASSNTMYEPHAQQHAASWILTLVLNYAK
jgi:FtsP/CotA-like multicopper oxidase with cupredoxin domain